MSDGVSKRSALSLDGQAPGEEQLACFSREWLDRSYDPSLAKLGSRYGLQGTRLHDARHTHASLLLRQGVHPKIVSERLGHASISITLDTYSHVLPGLQEAAALRFDAEVAAREPIVDGDVKRALANGPEAL